MELRDGLSAVGALPSLYTKEKQIGSKAKIEYKRTTKSIHETRIYPLICNHVLSLPCFLPGFYFCQDENAEQKLAASSKPPDLDRSLTEPSLSRSFFLRCTLTK